MAFNLFGRTIRKIGVIGSGNIGPDIALHFSQTLFSYDVPVVVVDIAQQALDGGLTKVSSKMAKAAEKGIFPGDDAGRIVRNMVFTPDYGRIADADFIVEAAFEKMDIKHRIFDQCEKACPATAIFASNSSHMVPEEIFERIADRSRSLVVHYFFPAERNLLVEVVPGRETDPALVEFLMRFYEFIGKAPIRVRSRYGYAVDPIFEGLFLATALTVEQGLAPVKAADAVAAKALGMGVGPFTAHNLAGGNPITRHGLTEMHSAIMPWYRSPRILDDQVARGTPWETAGKGEGVHISPEAEEAVTKQVTAAYIGMACEVVESGITSIGDLEMAIETGLVMTPPFALMNRIGVRESLRLVENYAKENPGFRVADLLVRQAGTGRPWRVPVVAREDHGDIAVVKIRRPRVLNALNEEVFEQLREVFTAIRKDPAIRGAVLTGFGTRAFVSGADIGMLASQKTPGEAERLCLKSQAVLNLIEDLGKPVVCAMNGLAFGGGNEMAMACTSRIARKGQKVFVSQPEPRLGIIPGNGGTQRLPRLIGIERAWPILRGAGTISSAQAREMGLIEEEVEGDLVGAAVARVGKILSGEIRPRAIPKTAIPVPSRLPEVDLGHLSRKTDSLLRKAILDGAQTTLEEGLKIEARTFGQCLLTRDMKIGLENFMKNGPRVNAPFVHG